jgi:hypothetical protein
MERRRAHCEGCPFRGGVPPGAREPGEGRVPLLCHESGCLDGGGPDLVCAGDRRAEEAEG